MKSESVAGLNRNSHPPATLRLETRSEPASHLPRTRACFTASGSESRPWNVRAAKFSPPAFVNGSIYFGPAPQIARPACVPASAPTSPARPAAMPGASLRAAVWRFVGVTGSSGVFAPANRPIKSVRLGAHPALQRPLPGGALGGDGGRGSTQNGVGFTASITGTTLTTTGNPSIAVRLGLLGVGVTAGTTVVSGSGKTWTVSQSQAVGSETMNTVGTDVDPVRGTRGRAS